MSRAPAAAAVQGRKTPPVLDGFTGDQRFFLGWAGLAPAGPLATWKNYLTLRLVPGSTSSARWQLCPGQCKIGCMNAEQVLEAALHLEPGERERLIERLMESLVGEKRFASEEIERAWLAEIQRRSAEIDAGNAEIIDWTGVRSRIAARRARP